MAGEETGLKFAVLDAEDLAVMSAHLQDAWAVPSDMTYLAKTRRFAMAVCRIDWARFAAGRQERRQAGFHFECVTRVQQSGMPRVDAEAKLQLLGVTFTPTAVPAGEILITFSGGGLIKLDVECLEAEMRDLGDSWPASDCRRHVLDEGVAGR